MMQVFRFKLQNDLKNGLQQCYCRLFCTKLTDKGSQKSRESENEMITKKDDVPKKTQVQDELKWRTPWQAKDVKYYDFLRSFYVEENNASLLQWIQKPVDLRPSALKNWWIQKKEKQDTFLQQYIPERHNTLGPELACAHFIVYRGGAVKFHDDDIWIKAKAGNYQLPNKYQKGMYLQAIDCTDMTIKYEGLANLRGLRNVEWLSFNSCKYVDDFCIDAVSSIFADTLKYLDLRDCVKVTERGLGALYKMNELKLLYLDDLMKDTRYELTCLLLEELKPDLQIKSDVIDFENPGTD